MIRPQGTFLGLEMAQSQKAIALWEIFLSFTNFERLIEFGTFTGNFSLFLYLFCLVKGAEFHTFDRTSNWLHSGNLDLKSHRLNFGTHFRAIDIFRHVRMLGDLIAKPGRTIVFCDNGNKVKEFKTFVRYLKIGDIIAVHDWNQEIRPRDIRYSCQKYNLKEIFLRESEDEGYTRFFQRSLQKKREVK